MGEAKGRAGGERPALSRPRLELLLQNKTQSLMSLDRFSNEIRKTGFELEYRISEYLRAHGWAVITGKYYVDDLQDTVRELDIVAYRSGKVEPFRVVTTIIVSCA